MQTILELLERAVADHGTTVALVIKPSFRTRTWTYADIGDQVPRLARVLRDAGIDAGDRVLIWSESRPEWCLAFLALLHADAVPVPVDVRTADEFATKIAAQVRATAVLASRSTAADASRLELPILSLEELVSEARRVPPLPRPDIGPETLAEVVFTSGTTGDPKGVMLTHRNIASNAAALRSVIPLGRETRVLSILPLSHMYGLTPGFLASMVAGTRIVFPTSRQPAVLARTFREQGVTMLLAVPQAVKLLTNAIERGVEASGRRALVDRMHAIGRHLPMALRRLLFRPILGRLGGQLRYIAVGAAPMNPHVARQWEEMGVTCLQGYGATELSPAVSFTRIERNRIGTVGEPIPGVEVRVARDGELLVRGPNVFRGYWERPDATAAVLDDDGWYHTGDHGTLDAEGMLTLHGRSKDIIVMPDGTKVHPNDLEKALIADERVRDAAVVGVERAGGDVEVHAALIVVPSAEDQGPDIVEAANRRLGGHQQIRAHSIWPDDDFPRTSSLKVRKPDVLRWISDGDTGPRPPAASALAQAAGTAVERLVRQLDGVNLAAVRADARLSSDLGLDSLGRVELLSLIEEELGISIDDGELEPDETVAGLQALVDAGSGSEPPTGIHGWPLHPVASVVRIGLQQALMVPLVALFYRRRVRGLEHLDGVRGPVLFAANHHLHLDNPVILASIPLRWRWRLSIAASAERVFDTPLRRFAVSLLGNGFPLAQSGSVRRSFDLLGARLDRGYSILIYPEGRLTVGGPLQELMAGTGLVATMADVPVVPVRLSIVRPGRIDRGLNGTALRGEVEVAFGAPLHFGSDVDAAEATERIRDAIERL